MSGQKVKLLNHTRHKLFIYGGLIPVAVLQTAYAQSPAIKSYQISAGSLDQVLVQFAAQSGVELSFDPSLIQHIQSTGLRGNYSVERGFDALLAPHALQAQKSSSGYMLSVVPHSVVATGNTTLKPIYQQTSNGTVLPKITVEAEDNNIYEQPRSVSVITRQQLDNRPVLHAADMLEQTSGVYSSVSQQDPALSVNIRGIQDFGRVNMNIDGMRQNFQKSGHGERNGQMYIDSELLSGVTIQKGPQSGMGGAGAFGGIATFKTVEAADFLSKDKNFGGKLHASTGTNASDFVGSTIVAGRSGNFDVLVGASDRNLGDYNPGTHGNIGDIRTSVNDVYNAGVTTAGIQDSLKHKKVLDSNYEMRSGIVKLGWDLAPDQRLQFSYLETDTDTPDVGTITAIYDDPTNLKGKYTLGWKRVGFSKIKNQNVAVDYTYNPANPLINLKSKLYFVKTKSHSDTYSTSALTDNGYWSNISTQTVGYQLENTSSFRLTEKNLLDVNYGVDIYQDKTTSFSSSEEMVGVTPSGTRTMASAFSNVSYYYDDWFKAEGGLRYDTYQLRGKTGIGITNIKDPCAQTRKALCTYKDTLMWDVNNKANHVSPTLALAVKPGLDWLELFANYGKSWRPPAITETLTSGSAHSSATQFPNPFLKPEISKGWEMGFNVQKQSLMTSSDRFVAKMAYFNTSVDNYASLATNRILPGYGDLASSGYAAYVNNLFKTRFRGLEYQLSYDAGFFYADFNYTRMLGKNEFCSKAAWLGNKIQFGGSAGNWYPEAYENNILACSNSTLKSGALSNINYLPGDRGSITLGGRMFDRRLDFGTIIRYNKGYQDHSAVSASGSVSAFYVADWPEYTLFDIYANYKFNEHLTLRGSIENVTDRAYIVSYGDSMSYTLGRGRTIQLGLEYSF